jgi:arabinose-5-phosphate isomerase
MSLRPVTRSVLDTHPASQAVPRSYMRLSAAQKTLALEAEGIQALIDFLDEKAFDQAIHIIQNTKQRLVITGMGKSGHIAKKIAATLSSTGQPSLFVHPAEAAHGDLGMITSDDSVLILSNGGESEELFTLIQYCKRFHIPIIGITKNPNSTLGKKSDCALVVPKSEEACPLNLVPTTSTTMMLALGDAIAVVLLKERGFDNQNFKVFHPGGKLGKQLLMVSDFMHKGQELPLICQEASQDTIIDCMSEKHFGCVGVIDEHGQLIGMITDGDVRRWIQRYANTSFNAEAIMNRDPLTVTPYTLMGEALSLMSDEKITAVFVCALNTKTPMGLIHIHDVLREGIL